MSHKNVLRELHLKKKKETKSPIQLEGRVRVDEKAAELQAVSQITVNTNTMGWMEKDPKRYMKKTINNWS